MIKKDSLYQLKNEYFANFCEPLKITDIEKILYEKKMLLPEDHISLLTITDGFDFYGGYFRLFGIEPTKKINLFSWNSDDLWKFSWNGKLNNFLCFGETAFGDQYAYKIYPDLKISSEIYFIESITMTPEIVSDNFEDFFHNEILRNAQNPYDQVIVDVRNRLGDLLIDEHVIYTPSPLISGFEDVNCVEKINRVASMIINGDLCAQLASQSKNKHIKEISPYVDGKGRSRLQVIWE